MKRNKFSLSNFKLFTLNMGHLVPINMMEVLPGDTIQQATSAMVRVAPLVHPVMHPVHCTIHHWYVPFRLLWEEWESFITHPSAGGGGLPVFPTLTLGRTKTSHKTLPDYFGIPELDPNKELTINALPFRAYYKIWNEFYRDQDLQDALPESMTGGNDEDPQLAVLKVNWKKDKFTSSRPWEEKGDAIRIPVDSSAPVYGNDEEFSLGYIGDPNSPDQISVGKVTTGAGNAGIRSMGLSRLSDSEESIPSGSNLVSPSKDTLDTFSEKTSLFADINSGTINDLRKAFAFQRFSEARARYGSRYVEYLRYLGVKSSDARLQRPEYLGGSRDPIQFSEVLQTSPDAGEATGHKGLGNLGGHGIGALKTKRYRRFFEEHGVVLTLMNVSPIPVYTQGVDRFFFKNSQFDFYQKELAHIGPQEIYQGELYAQLGDNEKLARFGYEDRYEEYRSKQSTVCGAFRGDLKNWHMGRDFSAKPTLNSDFIECNPTTRIYADTNADQLQVMAKHSIQARRMVAKSGGPGRI